MTFDQTKHLPETNGGQVNEKQDDCQRNLNETTQSSLYLGISTLTYETSNLEKFKSVIHFSEINDDQVVVLLRWTVRKEALPCFNYIISNYEFKNPYIFRPKDDDDATLSENVELLFRSIFSSDNTLKFLDELFLNTTLRKRDLLTLKPLRFCRFTHNSRKESISNILTFLNIGETEIIESPQILVHCAEFAHHAFIIIWKLMRSTNKKVEGEEEEFKAKKHNIENLIVQLLDKLMGSTYQTHDTLTAITLLIYSPFYSLTTYNSCSLDLLTYSVYLGNICLLKDIMTKTPGLLPDQIKNTPFVLFTYALKIKDNQNILEILAAFYGLDQMLKDPKDIHTVIPLLINQS